MVIFWDLGKIWKKYLSYNILQEECLFYTTLASSSLLRWSYRLFRMFWAVFFFQSIKNARVFICVWVFLSKKNWNAIKKSKFLLLDYNCVLMYLSVCGLTYRIYLLPRWKKFVIVFFICQSTPNLIKHFFAWKTLLRQKILSFDILLRLMLIM